MKRPAVRPSAVLAALAVVAWLAWFAALQFAIWTHGPGRDRWIAEAFALGIIAVVVTGAAGLVDPGEPRDPT